MEVKVKVPDEIAARAKARGVRVEDYALEVLAQQAAKRTPNGAGAITPEEIRPWLDSLAQFSDKIPPLPETVSRDWIYQDHN